MPPQDETIKKIARYYLFWGPNAYLLNKRVSSLIRAVLPAGAEAFDLDRFDGKGCDMPSVINAVSTSPVLSPLRVIILADVDKVAASGQTMLESFLSKIPEYSVLAMTAPKLDKRSKLFKRLSEEKDHTKLYDDYKPDEIVGIVAKFAADRGKKIMPDVAEMIIDTFGNDAYRLENEVEKLALYIGDKSVVEKKDLAFATGFTKVEAAWDLPDLIFRGKPKEALELARRAIASGISEIQLLYTIKNHLAGVNAARSHSDIKSMMSEMRMPYFRAKELFSRSRIIDQQTILQGLTLVFRAEYSLKSARFRSEAIIELLIASLCLAAQGNNHLNRL
jgi:DNA polymerase-3 subunit delta